METLTVYDQDMKMLAILDHADKIGYELKHNDMWTGSFSLPAWDPKNEYCQAHNLVRLPDGPRDTGIYRIVGMPSGEETALQGMRHYSLEHVMATLLDDLLFGYHEIGGTGVRTRDVMQYILDHQRTQQWQLGACEFNDQFQYHFENVSLLSALLSLGQVLTQEYTWEFDTDTTPWTVNLRKADTEAGCGIHYGRNLVKITKSMDATALVTRLYPLGYGEGVNQLNIAEINGGQAYIDADTVGTWGVKCSVWTDTRIQDAATLMARAQQVLEGYKNPYLSYTAKAVDLYRETGFSWDNYMPGKLVRVMDDEHAIHFDARIVAISKRDVNGDPGDIEITIANAPRDAADSISTLADRVGIGELYSQGATNLFAIPFADNADERHPAKFRVYIPQGMVRINRMLLSWRLAAFRAYSTGAAAGGSTTRTSSSGGGSTQTTSSSDTVVYTSENGGDCTVVHSKTVVNDDGSYEFGWVGSPLADNGYRKTSTDANTGLGTETDEAGGHTHTMGHTHTLAGHKHTVNSHSHTMNHSHSIPAHSHGYSHHHEVNSHYHQVNSHWHGLNGHTHSFSGSMTLQWGHQHKIGSGEYTAGVYNYADKSIAISGETGGCDWGTESAEPYTTAEAPSTGTPKDGLGNSISNTGETSLETNELVGRTGTTGPDTNTIDTQRTSGALNGDNPIGSTGSNGAHTHSIPMHSHGMDHVHKLVMYTLPEISIDIPAHGHNVRVPGHSHSVSIPAHTHDLTLPDHEHGIVYGIYEGGRASDVTIVVDDMQVSADEVTAREIDVAKYLSKDDAGKIRRGTWHEIQIVPDKLTRIEANLTAQVFVQSVGGGDY